MRRPKLLLGFIFLELLSSCAPRPAARYKPVPPVYRATQEESVEPEGFRKKLLESNPEVAELAKLVAADPKNVELQNALAEAYLANGLPWSAHAHFTEARINGGGYRTEMGLARLWDGWQDTSAALQHAAAAITFKPGSAEAHELLGIIYLHARNPAEAINRFRRSLELAPDAPAVIANLGYAQMLEGHLVEARLSFETALSLNSNLSEARNNLGIVLAQMGDYEGAIDQMAQVGSPEAAFNNLGVVLLSLRNDPVGAIQAFLQALEYAPGYEKAQANLSAARAMLPVPVFVDLPLPASQPQQ